MSGIEWEVPEDQPFSERTWAEASGRSYELTGDQRRQHVLMQIERRLESLALAGASHVQILVGDGFGGKYHDARWLWDIQRDVERALKAK